MKYRHTAVHLYTNVYSHIALGWKNRVNRRPPRGKRLSHPVGNSRPLAATGFIAVLYRIQLETTHSSYGILPAVNHRRFDAQQLQGGRPSDFCRRDSYRTRLEIHRTWLEGNIESGWRNCRTWMETNVAPGWKTYRTRLEERSHPVGNYQGVSLSSSIAYTKPKCSKIVLKRRFL